MAVEKTGTAMILVMSGHQSASVPLARRGFIRTACASALDPSALVDASAQLPEEPVVQPQARRFDERDYMREELTHLCLMMEMFQTWYKEHEPAIRAYSRRASSTAGDVSTEGVMAARKIARAAGIRLDPDYIRSYAERCAADRREAAQHMI